jgi:hypothetical protein
MRRLGLFAVAIGCVAALLGCATTPLVQRWTRPERFTVARQQLLLHSDFPLPQHHRLLDDLLMLRGELVRQLAVPTSDEPIHVYLFESSERFDGFMRLYHPQFPNRRAFFVETDTRLAVYAQWGDRVAEDLRHEVTHAYLRSVVRTLPVWLDEGLAEYYEVPRTGRGLNRPHVEHLLERMRRNHWQPDLRKLERIPDDRDLDQNEYAESWAWVHFMLESRTETAELLRSHLTKLRTDGTAESLSATLERLGDRPEQALSDHIRSLGAHLKH